MGIGDAWRRSRRVESALGALLTDPCAVLNRTAKCEHTYIHRPVRSEAPLTGRAPSGPRIEPSRWERGADAIFQIHGA
jgi:hypothetical protein